MVCNVNEVMHDTIDTAAVVALQFDAVETEDESVNVDAALGVMKNGSTDGIVLDEFSLIVVPTNDPYLADLEVNEEVDLDKFEMMETSAFCKKIRDLFKIRSIMKKYDEVWYSCQQCLQFCSSGNAGIPWVYTNCCLLFLHKMRRTYRYGLYFPADNG